jgi:hypothetical protein
MGDWFYFRRNSRLASLIIEPVWVHIPEERSDRMRRGGRRGSEHLEVGTHPIQAA